MQIKGVFDKNSYIIIEILYKIFGGVSLCSFYEVAFIAAAKFHLQGCIIDLKLVVQQLADLLDQFAGLAYGHIMFQVHMSLKMNLFIVQAPEVDMMQVCYSGNIFNLCFYFFKVDVFGSGLHKDIEGITEQEIGLFHDIESDQECDQGIDPEYPELPDQYYANNHSHRRKGIT